MYEPVSSLKMWPFLVFLVLIPSALSGFNERRLLHKLLANYTKEERPSLNHALPVDLTFGLELRQIIDLDEKQQVRA